MPRYKRHLGLVGKKFESRLPFPVDLRGWSSYPESEKSRPLDALWCHVKRNYFSFQYIECA